MKISNVLTAAAAALLMAVPFSTAGEKITVTGLSLPDDYRSWTAVAPSHRTDKGHIRMMLANPIMVEAYKAGKKTFPDGSKIIKLVYEADNSDTWEEAVVPGKPISIEIMVKDSEKYPEQKGWEFGRYTAEGEPIGTMKLYKTCFPCHEANVAGQDYIFTRWAP